MKHYLGDSVYAEVQSGMIKLTTDNGSGPNNTIFLEDFVMENLAEFYKREFLRQPTALSAPDSEDHKSD